MSSPDRIEKEQQREHRLRIRLEENRKDEEVYVDPNEDIYDVPKFQGCFTKSLIHDPDGIPDQKETEKMLHGINRCWCSLDQISYPGSLRLMNPSAVHSYDIVGPFKACTYIPPVPRLGSPETAVEMIELYNMALMRDIPFKSYSTSQQAMLACTDLGTTPETLFRTELTGHYVSQFLLLPYSHGCVDVEQKLRCYPPGVDFMKTWDLALSCQNGSVQELLPDRTIRRHIINLRDGVTYVHLDDSIQSGLAVACILDRLKCPGPKGIVKETRFLDLGRLDLLDIITAATRAAMMTAWYHKWSICRIRPECVGMYVHRAIIDGVNPGIHKSLLESPVLNRVYSKFGCYLLPQAYPEGSPAHPAYPAGHAVSIGVMTTILKAFYDEDFLIDGFETSDDGSQLLPLGQKFRVGDELNKLASNISNFRNAAGVHYRSDSHGIEMGERIAINVLKDYVRRYCHNVTFSFHKRNGRLVIISN